MYKKNQKNPFPLSDLLYLYIDPFYLLTFLISMAARISHLTYLSKAFE